MTQGPPERLNLCPSCGATLSAGREPCPVCTSAAASAAPQVRASPQLEIDPNPYAPSAPCAGEGGPTFRLSTLMLTMTLIAVCLGIGTWNPGIAIALAALATPAFVRTALAGVRLRKEGKPPTIEEKVFIFFASLAIVTMVVLASGVAFYATCWVGFFAGMSISDAAGARGYDPIEYGLVTGVPLGAFAGLGALILACYYLWPYRKF